MTQLSTLVDNGNFIEIPEQNLSIYKMAVNNVTIKPQSVIINTRDKEVFSLDSREFVGFPDGQTLGDTVIEYINNLNIGGSSGTFSSVDSITTVSGQISAVPIVETNDIVFYNLPEPLTEEAVLLGSIQVISSDGAVTTLNTTNLSILGNTLTLPDNNVFVTDDKVAVALKSSLQGYDYLVNAYKVMIENPEWNHYTSVEHILDETNIAIAKYFTAFDVASYRNLAIQLRATDSTNLTIKIYGTLDDSATVPVTDGTPGETWVDMTLMLFGETVSSNDVSKLAFVDTSIMLDRYLLEYTTESATNSIDCWIRKY